MFRMFLAEINLFKKENGVRFMEIWKIYYDFFSSSRIRLHRRRYIKVLNGSIYLCVS